MQRLILYVVAVLMIGVITWWLVALPRIELAELNHNNAAEKVVELQRLDVQRVELIRNQQLQIIEITDNERRNRELLQVIEGQSRAQSHALKELEKNDQTITDYLRSGVPADLGRLYQRAAATDPGDYRKQAAVRPDPVPTASAASASD